MAYAPRSWKIRRGFWAKWQTLRFDLSRPKWISLPEENRRPIELKRFCDFNLQLPLENIRTFDHLPGIERAIGMRVLVNLGLWIGRVYPQMQPGVPEIDADIDTALDEGLLPVYRSVFRRPSRPPAYDVPGAPDLGDLAVEGPYALFIERDGKNTLKWDFEFLGDYEHHPDLVSLAVKVIFSDPKGKGRPQPQKIVSRAWGEVKAGQERWDDSVRLAICAATTHLALTRHFNFVHLISGTHWDCATRNHLPTDHVLYRLLWPHIFDSCYTNYGVTRVQLAPDGDFVNMFSFTHAGLMAYFDDQHLRYDYRMMDPELDWERRGLDDALADRPSQDNLLELFEVMHRHARRYVHHYYATDEALAEDRVLLGWLRVLHGLVPGGIDPETVERPTRAGLARLLGAYIYEGNTIHEVSGTNLWDYQLWADQNPVRIYRTGQRLPQDVYQRVINNNFALQLERDPLCEDYGDLALDQGGRRLFKQFAADCRSLQVSYDLQRWNSGDHPIWRMEPRNLNISMNG